jgi:hypothetical protein
MYIQIWTGRDGERRIIRVYLRLSTEKEDVEETKKPPLAYSALVPIPTENDYIAKDHRFMFNTYYNQLEACLTPICMVEKGKQM